MRVMKRVDQAQNLKVPCRLLIVAGRRLMGQGLEAMFFEAGSCRSVCVETDARRALGRVLELKPDVVLIDLRLPSGDAFGLARSIRIRCPSARLIFLDDSLHKGRLRTALKFCGAGYFTQEDSFETLQEAVLQVAAGRWAFSESAVPHIDQADGKPLCKPPADNPGLGKLTRRQIEVLTLLSHGMTVKQCARQLRISPSTVDNHKSRLMARLGVHKSVDLVRVALQEGLLEERLEPCRDEW